MSGLRRLAAAARASGEYDALLEALPYGRYMGFRARVVERETVRLRLPFDDRFVGNPVLPSLHGGVVGAVLETVALLQLIHVARAEHMPRTINFAVDYLRQARLEDLNAEAELLRQGRRIANLRMTVWQRERDRPVATGRGNFLLA